VSIILWWSTLNPSRIGASCSGLSASANSLSSAYHNASHQDTDKKKQGERKLTLLPSPVLLPAPSFFSLGYSTGTPPYPSYSHPQTLRPSLSHHFALPGLPATAISSLIHHPPLRFVDRGGGNGEMCGREARNGKVVIWMKDEIWASVVGRGGAGAQRLGLVPSLVLGMVQSRHR
jgi:hypothetical protein